MSFLILGNDLESLLFSKYLLDCGWKVSIAAPNSFKFTNEFVIIDEKVLSSIDLKASSSSVRNIRDIEVKDFLGNSQSFSTNTSLVNIAPAKTALLKELKELGAKIYENASFIDKNNENIFLKVNDSGILLKEKYIINFSDIELSKKLGNTQDLVEYSSAIIKEKTNEFMELFFFEGGYGWKTNINANYSFIQMYGKNLKRELELIRKRSGTEIIKESSVCYPSYSGKFKGHKDGIFLAGRALGLCDPLNLDCVESGLKYYYSFREYFHNLMAGNAKNYNSLLGKEFSYLKKQSKMAKVFWNSSLDDRKELLGYLYPYRFALDFNSMFNNLPRFSKQRIKLLLS